MSVSSDSPISISLLRQGYKQLANNLGNLQMRVLKMVDKNLSALVPSDASLSAEDTALLNQIASGFKAVYQKDLTLEMAISLADEVMKACTAVNGYFAANAPWVLAKDESQKERFKAVIYTTLDALRLIATALYPLMPNTAKAILTSLGLDASTIRADFEGAKLSAGKITVPEPLFPFLPE